MVKTPTKRKYFEDLVALSKSNNTFNKRTIQALSWHKNKVTQAFGIKDTPPEQFFDKTNYPNLPIPGNIITFKYMPVGKADLPFYDIFPLVLVIKLVPGGFLGLNFHYLHPIDRAIFMSRLQRFERPFNKTTRINIRYNTLNRLPGIPFHKECIKLYKKKSIRSMFYTLTPEEWDIALFLPTEKFIKVPKQRIWNESRKRVRGQKIK